MANIYDKRRIWKWAFLSVSLLLVLFFLYVSNNLVDDMSQQERARMEIWAEATKQLASAPVFTADPMSDVGSEVTPQSTTNIDFLLGIIEGNRNIPVLLVDANDNILQYRNFRLPEPVDSLAPFELSPTNAEFLQNKLNALRHTKNHIAIVLINFLYLFRIQLLGLLSE